MRIAIIVLNNIKYCPYILPYTRVLDEMKADYKIIYLNRDCTENKDANAIEIKWNKSRSKAVNLLYFSVKARKILRREKFDFIISLTTMNSVLLCDYLVEKYNTRYIVDVRDYTHEGNRIFYKLETSVLKHARLRIISSPAFRKFLPDLDYCLCHNTTYDFAQEKRGFDKANGRIKIGYIGSILYAENCCRLIDLVVRDERFEFDFYGNEAEGDTVTSYIKATDNSRIKYRGSYEPKQKSEIIESVDILFNVYGNDSKLVLHAVSNKLYDSFFFKKPLLTSPGTIMSEIAEKFSFDIDESTENLDSLYEWYHGIRSDEMVEYMSSQLQNFSRDMTAFRKALKDALGDIL